MAPPMQEKKHAATRTVEEPDATATPTGTHDTTDITNEEARTAKAKPRTAKPVDTADVARVLFTDEDAEPDALPATLSQKANAEWVKSAGAPIKLTGPGRTVQVVRHEMECFALGASTARKLVGDAGLFVQPNQKQADHNAWVAANLKYVDEDERKKVLPLTGEGRTVEAVGADIALVIAGAKRATGHAVDALPVDVSQAANAAWVQANGASGLIKLTGSGRTVEAVRRGMCCFKAGADAAGRLLRGETALTEQPEQTQAAHNAWVKEWLDADERKKVLPLTGQGRTAEAVGADIALVIAGAKAQLW